MLMPKEKTCVICRNSIRNDLCSDLSSRLTISFHAFQYIHWEHQSVSQSVMVCYVSCTYQPSFGSHRKWFRKKSRTKIFFFMQNSYRRMYFVWNEPTSFTPSRTLEIKIINRRRVNLKRMSRAGAGAVCRVPFSHHTIHNNCHWLLLLSLLWDDKMRTINSLRRLCPYLSLSLFAFHRRIIAWITACERWIDLCLLHILFFRNDWYIYELR